MTEPREITQRRPGRRTSAFAALFFIGILMGASIGAGWLAPYDPGEEQRVHSYHPPTPIHFWDREGRFHVRPFVYATQARYTENLSRIYEEDDSVPYFIRFMEGRLVSVERPAKIYLLGTDSRGRDLFSRILFGSRISLSLGLLGALVATLAGLLIGGISGYFGGILDQFLMRVAEFFIMIPAFYLLLALRSALPAGLDSRKVYLLIVVILSLISWGGIARVIRGMVLSIRESDFLQAARILGRGDGEILLRHVFPHTFSYVAIVLSVSVPGYILGEAALSLLGLGIQEPAVSWGNLLTESLAVAHLSLHPWVLAPGFFIILTSFCFNWLGDEMRKPEML